MVEEYAESKNDYSLEDYSPTNETSDGFLDIEEEPTGDCLEAYNGGVTKLGLAIDSGAARSIFYIGNDSELHRVQEIKGKWRNVDLSAYVGTDNSKGGGDGGDDSDKQDEDKEEDKDQTGGGKNQGEVEGEKTGETEDEAVDDNQGGTEDKEDRGRVWPPADDPDADFAVAFDSYQDRIWIYYVANGGLTQAHQSGAGTWEPAALLPKRNDTPGAVTSSKSQDGEGEAGAGEGEDKDGGSGGGKTGVGVGVGVGLGVPMVASAIAAYMFLHSRRSRRNRDAEFSAAAQQDPGASDARLWAGGSPAPEQTYSGYWANGQWVDEQEQRYSMNMNPNNNNGSSYDLSLGGAAAVVNPRYSSVQLYPPQQKLHEMPHQEPMHEVAGDGQVPEMSATTPLIAKSTAPLLLSKEEKEEDSAEQQQWPLAKGQ